MHPILHSFGFCRRGRSIIRGVDNNGIIAQSSLLDCIHDLTHQLIHIPNLIRKDSLPIRRTFTDVRIARHGSFFHIQWRYTVRAVSQIHGVHSKKRRIPLPIIAHNLTDEISQYIGSVILHGGFQNLSIMDKPRLPVAGDYGLFFNRRNFPRGVRHPLSSG